MKLWIDDIRPAPNGYIWVKSVNQTITIIKSHTNEIELIDLDHDAGDYAKDGGDFIKVLDFLEMNMLNYPIRIHTMNPVGRQNMRAIIQANHWQEI